VVIPGPRGGPEICLMSPLYLDSSQTCRLPEG